MKKTYTMPDLEVTVIQTNDIIMVSDESDTFIDAEGALDKDANN